MISFVSQAAANTDIQGDEFVLMPLAFRGQQSSRLYRVMDFFLFPVYPVADSQQPTWPFSIYLLELLCQRVHGFRILVGDFDELDHARRTLNGPRGSASFHFIISLGSGSKIIEQLIRYSVMMIGRIVFIIDWSGWSA